MVLRRRKWQTRAISVYSITELLVWKVSVSPQLMSCFTSSHSSLEVHRS